MGMGWDQDLLDRLDDENDYIHETYVKRGYDKTLKHLLRPKKHGVNFSCEEDATRRLDMAVKRFKAIQ